MIKITTLNIFFRRPQQQFRENQFIVKNAKNSKFLCTSNHIHLMIHHCICSPCSSQSGYQHELPHSYKYRKGKYDVSVRNLIYREPALIFCHSQVYFYVPFQEILTPCMKIPRHRGKKTAFLSLNFNLSASHFTNIFCTQKASYD